MNYKTPGVLRRGNCKNSLPSVAQVETGYPCFYRYTEKGPKNEPTRISSMLEYEAIFGMAKEETFEITETVIDGVITTTATVTPSPFKMYYAMQMYFANGGGACYIVSVNTFQDEDDEDNLVEQAELEAV